MDWFSRTEPPVTSHFYNILTGKSGKSSEFRSVLGALPFPPRLDVGIDPDIFFDDDGRVWYVGTAAPEKPNFPGEGWAPGWKWLVYHGDDLICLSLSLSTYICIYMYISHMHIYIYIYISHTHQ